MTKDLSFEKNSSWMALSADLGCQDGELKALAEVLHNSEAVALLDLPAGMHVCMYLCMYVCMYVCMCIYMWYVFMYVCMYVCMYIYMCVSMYVCMYVRMYVCIYVCMHTCMYVCVHIYRTSQKSAHSQIYCIK